MSNSKRTTMGRISYTDLHAIIMDAFEKYQNTNQWDCNNCNPETCEHYSECAGFNSKDPKQQFIEFVANGIGADLHIMTHDELNTKLCDYHANMEGMG